MTWTRRICSLPRLLLSWFLFIFGCFVAALAILSFLFVCLLASEVDLNNRNKFWRGPLSPPPPF